MDPTVEELLLQRAAAGFPIPARRRHGLPAPIRELHRRVLGHFAATGELAGAYPFVANPRGHQVHLTGGLTVQAYCAIDALGIPAMLDQDATITSHDPLTGVPITVEVRDGRAHPMPAGVVVGYVIDHRGAAGDAGDAGQAACCRCPLINFHVSPATAQSWQQRQGVRLELLAIPHALQLGAAVFGDLLRSPDSADQDPSGAAATASWTIAARGGRPDDSLTP